MLLAGSRLTNAPVMGLQTGSELGKLSDPIINPDNLAILAYEVEGPLLDKSPSILRIADVREFSDIGVIIDSSDEFITLGDVIKLDEIYNLHFSPLGMKVVDKKRKKLGKVDGYTIETTGFVIQQLSVKRSFFQSLGDTQLLIHRSQIVEINDSEIVVHSEAKAPEPKLHKVQNNYINPFRKNPQAEHSERR